MINSSNLKIANNNGSIIHFAIHKIKYCMMPKKQNKIEQNKISKMSDYKLHTRFKTLRNSRSVSSVITFRENSNMMSDVFGYF